MKPLYVHLVLSVTLLATGSLALAGDTVSFGTVGWANKLRTPEMMNKIDTDGDGMVSRPEWDTYHKKIFVMIDVDRSGALDTDEFMREHSKEVASFATGGYANAMRTTEVFAMLDTDKDGKVSEQEFVSVHTKMFDMMDTDKKGMLDQTAFIGRGPAR